MEINIEELKKLDKSQLAQLMGSYYEMVVGLAQQGTNTDGAKQYRDALLKDIKTITSFAKEQLNRHNIPAGTTSNTFLFGEGKSTDTSIKIAEKDLYGCMDAYFEKFKVGDKLDMHNYKAWRQGMPSKAGNLIEEPYNNISRYKQVCHNASDYEQGKKYAFKVGMSEKEIAEARDLVSKINVR